LTLPLERLQEMYLMKMKAFILPTLSLSSPIQVFGASPHFA